MAPVPIEERIKKELPVINNAMVVGDRKKFLSVLLTLKVSGAHPQGQWNLKGQFSTGSRSV